jgi:hypothetical protein
MTNISINLKNTYLLSVSEGSRQIQIKIDAYFKEEAIIIFQKKYQKVGPKYYHPTVFTKIEKM